MRRLRYSARWNRPSVNRSPARSRRTRRAAVVVLILVFGLASLIWGWRISDIEIIGSTLTPNAAVRDAALAELQKTRWMVIPRASWLFCAPPALASALRDKFAFAAVNVHRHWNRLLSITITEQPIAGVALAAGQNPALFSGSGQIIGSISEDQLVNYGVSGSGAPSVLVISSTRPTPKIGDVFVPEKTVTLLREFWQELSGAGAALAPRQIVQRSGSAASFDIRTTNNAQVTISQDELAQSQLSKLRAVLSKYPSEISRSKLRSIDLRYGDRVYLQ